jgi:hypothetical protein
MLTEGAPRGCFPSVWREAHTSSSSVRPDNAPKVRFSVEVGEEPEIDLALV